MDYTLLQAEFLVNKWHNRLATGHNTNNCCNLLHSLLHYYSKQSLFIQQPNLLSLAHRPSKLLGFVLQNKTMRYYGETTMRQVSPTAWQSDAPSSDGPPPHFCARRCICRASKRSLQRANKSWSTIGVHQLEFLFHFHHHTVSLMAIRMVPTNNRLD